MGNPRAKAEATVFVLGGERVVYTFVHLLFLCVGVCVWQPAVSVLVQVRNPAPISGSSLTFRW